MTDVSSTRRTATGVAFAGRTRLRAIYYVGSGTAGTLTFRNGSGSGETLCTISTPASATEVDCITIPGDGILFSNGIHVTVADVGSVTLFYG